MAPPSLCIDSGESANCAVPLQVLPGRGSVMLTIGPGPATSASKLADWTTTDCSAARSE